MTSRTSEQVSEGDQTPPTDEELVAKARGQFAAAIETLQELAARDLNITLNVNSDDTDQWFCRLIVKRTTYL